MSANDMGSILVPTDFTSVADTAIEHAMKLADTTGGEVHLLHVVGKKEEVEGARGRLTKEVAKAQKHNVNVKVRSTVRIGSIFDDIGDAASEIGARMIIMGTHGMKGLQYLVGSNALRVITQSSVPFIVVQRRGINANGYKHIVVPLDLNKETKQKLALVAEIAKHFRSKVHLITPNESDEFLHNQLHRNIVFARQYLAERGIEHDATIAEEDSGGFVKAVMKHAIRVDADLITIMNLKQNSLLGILGTNYEQALITNEPQIPVMCMNPKDTSDGGGSWSFQ